jgi:D-serine deaminase-like pyridoxal phosphate-dependent protein
MPRPPVHTIQQTAKTFKAWQAGGLALLFAGTIATVVSDHKKAGVVIFAVGLITYTIARIAAWWHHG